ncbi:MAG: hypothetical protein ACUZ8I_07825, partial [Candidatus Scalindua sp.]
MPLDPLVNFGKVDVSIGYNAAATSIVLASGQGAELPSTFSYNIVWWNATDYSDPSDDPNVEIVRVTNRVTDTLTVTRAQEGTSASTKNTSGKTYKMILAITKKTIDDIAEYFDGTRIATQFKVDNLQLDGNTISSLGGDIILSPTDDIAILNSTLQAAEANMVHIASQDFAVGDARLYVQGESGNYIIIGGSNIEPETDGVGDLGTQTTTQWANVWSDNINGIAEANLADLSAAETIEGAWTFNSDIIISTINGIDYNPGSDVDVDIATIGVTGTPRFFWNETTDSFEMTKDLTLPGASLRLGPTAVFSEDLIHFEERASAAADQA